MNRFTQIISRRLFDLKIRWNSLGLWSRIRGKNKVMAHLLRRPKRKVFLKLGRLFVVLQPRRFGVTSNGIGLPDPPKKTNKTLSIVMVYDTSLIPFGKTNVVMDRRETEAVLDDIRKKLCR